MNATPPVFHIQTFGCQMNAADSEWLARSLRARGFVEGSFENAVIHIINTCSVRDKPEQKVYSELGRIARFCKVNRRKGITVCVGGCVAQQVGPSLTRRFPQVRLLFGTDGITRAPEAIERLMESPSLRLALLDFSEGYEERFDVRLEVPGQSIAAGLGSFARTPAGAEPGRAEGEHVPPSVFVNIMQGCDNYCTYCIVPYVRGRQKSRRAEAVLHECRILLEKGAREITLLGQNVNSYGQDSGADGTPFAGLLRKVAALPGLERLRFITPHPKDIAPELIAAFADLESLCPRLHLPLQSGSDKILRAMNRRYDTARYRGVVAALRKARPDLVLSTDIIVGFPGETEEDFQDTLRIMQEIAFTASFSFIYSDRPGARAALLPDKIDRAVALERLSRLQEWQNKASDEILESMTGQDCTVLLESRSRWELVLEKDNTGEIAPDPPFFSPEHSRDSSARYEARADQTGVLPGDGEKRPYEAWQGKTPQGFIVNVNLPVKPEKNRSRQGWEGALLPVRIEAAAKHSLKGRQIGAPW